MSELDEYLLLDEPEGWSEAEIDPPAEDDLSVERKAPFRLDGDKTAMWAMRKLRRARARIADNHALADEQYEAIRSWLDEVNAQPQRDAAYFEGLLIDYAMRCRLDPEDGRKTVSVPGGKVATREATGKVDVDQAMFVPWAHEHAPDLLRIKVEPALTDIKKNLTFTDNGTAVTADGEIIPGVTAEPARLTATVKIDD